MREASELAKVGGWGFDPVTLQADWTPEVAHLYGLPDDAPPTMENALEFFTPDKRPILKSALTAAIEDGLPHDMELQLISAAGEKKGYGPFAARSSRTVESYESALVSLQDITDRKRVESDLRASEERYRMLFDSNPHLCGSTTFKRSDSWRSTMQP